MADDHDASNEVNENDDGGEFDYEDATTTPPSVTAPSVVQNTTASLAADDYDDDEPIEDYVVNLVVNEKPDGLPSGLVDAVVTDSYGNTIYNSINSVTTSVYDELNGNGTALTGGKRWFGWSTAKILLIGLIALCILGIILAAIFFVISKKKNQRTTTSPGSTTTTKAVVTKGVSPDPKYQPVPNV